MVKELRNQLKSQTLGEVSPDAFKQVGSSVYPDSPSIQDLAAFREIVHSFQSVHLPTLGSPIPKTSFYKDTSVSGTTTDLITAGSNEILEIISIAAATANNYELSAAALYLYPNGNDSQEYPILALPDVDSTTESFGSVMYGAAIDVKGTPLFIGQPLYLNGGDTLGLITKFAPTSSLTVQIVYRKVMQ